MLLKKLPDIRLIIVPIALLTALGRSEFSASAQAAQNREAHQMTSTISNPQSALELSPLEFSPPGEAAWQRLPAHPRLFANDARIEALKTQDDEVSRQLMALLRYDAEKRLAGDEIVYPPTGFLFGPAREVQGRILTLALMYRLSGEKRYFERARRELLQLAALPEWRTSHFLDVGEAALAAGIGLDWLYDDLAEEDRATIAKAIVHNALLPSLAVPTGENSWVNGDFNWTQVCHGGVVIAALAIAEREPQLARRIVARAIENMPRVSAVYAPDGSFPEAPNYWSYGTTFHVMLIEALRGALGTSVGLETAPGFLKTGDYLTQVIAPSGQEYNYSDSSALEPSEPVILWFARELGARDTARGELANIAAAYTGIVEAEAKAGKPVKSPRLSRHLALELIWWNPALPPLAPQSTLPLHWTAGGQLPMGVLRSAWNDSGATYLAVKGGTPNHSHGHMDVGSFILEADGVRWALDLGSESYGKMREAKLDLWNYSQDSNRWTTFRVGPEGHNILRFDGARQNIEGAAKLAALPVENGIEGNVLDLTPLYAGQAASVHRAARLYSDRSISIDDAWTAGAKPVEVTFQWLTRARTSHIPGGLKLEQKGESLELRIAAPAPFTVEIEDVSKSHAVQDSPNPELTRILIRQKTPAGSTGRLSVRAIPGSTLEKP